MDTMKVAAVAVCGAVMALTLRRARPEAGAALALAAGVMVALMALPALGQVVGGLAALARTGGVSDRYMAQLLKVTGVSMLADFAAQTCRDAGEEGLAVKTELAGRVMLLSLALPFMRTLLSQVLSLSP